MDMRGCIELGKHFADALHAVDRRDEGAIERMVALFSPEARLLNASLKLANEERTGHEGARAFWEHYQGSFAEAATEFFQITANDQAAGLFWTTRGADATGQPVEYDGVTLLVFDEERKIALFRGYYDTRELSKKVGA